MIAPRFTTLRDFFRQCYKPLKLRGRNGDGARLHEITLNNFAKYLGREATFSDLESDTIACFLAWMRERGRAAVTANDNLNRLMALSRFAKERGHLAQIPYVQPEVEPERVPRAWLEADLEKLFAACAAQSGAICGAPASLWWVTLHLVCLFTGERITAVMSLRWDQVDLDLGWMVLTAEQRKGKKRDKEWPLPNDVVAALRRLKQHVTGDLVFARDFSIGTLYYRYSKILKQAGLPTSRDSKFHRIRKTTASHFAAAGGNATVLLDHSSTKVTRRYIDKRIVREQSAADVLVVPAAARTVINPKRIA